MTDFDIVIAYICGFDPGFDGSVVPADPARINELENLVGRPLPDSYRSFLRCMGGSAGWLAMDEMDYSINVVLDFYRRTDWFPADRFIRIGLDRKDPSFHPHLRLFPYQDKEPEVVGFPGCRPDTLKSVTTRMMFDLAGSLEELFCRPAFEIYEIYGEAPSGDARQPANLMAGASREEAVTEASSLAETLGFTVESWSTHQAGGYWRSDAAAQSVQRLGFPLQVLVRADDPAEQRRLATAFRDGLGLI